VRTGNIHLGESTQAAGVAAWDLDGNGVKDLVLFSIDHPDDQNTGYLFVRPISRRTRTCGKARAAACAST